jgi:hypothetical protein
VVVAVSSVRNPLRTTLKGEKKVLVGSRRHFTGRVRVRWIEHIRMPDHPHINRRVHESCGVQVDDPASESASERRSRKQELERR